MKITTIVPVYTDGCIFNNQRMEGKITVGGIGVFFPDYKEYNVSEPFTNEPITNNRAELTAVMIAILKFMVFKIIEGD